MGKFNRQQIDDMLLLFSGNQEMTFHTDCLQICMKCQILFSGKNKKKDISKCRLLNFSQHTKRLE